MKIDSNSWHYKLLFSRDWYAMHTYECPTLCSYNWAVVTRLLTTLAIVAVALLLSFTFSSLLVVMPMVWVYSCFAYGFHLDIGALGLGLDAFFLYCFLFAVRDSKEIGIAKDSWIKTAYRDFKEKHCTILEYAE